MEPKKNPEKDLNRNQGLYFMVGLVLVLILTLVALEWKTYAPTYDYTIAMNVEDDLVEEIPMTVQIKTQPPPPPAQAPPIIEIAKDDEDVEETVIETTETDQDEVVEVSDIIVEEVPDEIDEVPFIAIEDVPVFPGCETEKGKGAEAMRNCFQQMMNKHISKNFKYPEIAQEMGIQGRVNIIFTIQKDGTIGNIRMRGPDKSLEAEARRIIEKLPKMEPGMQRKRPVRVPFSVPINFKLQ